MPPLIELLGVWRKGDGPDGPDMDALLGDRKSLLLSGCIGGGTGRELYGPGPLGIEGDA